MVNTTCNTWLCLNHHWKYYRSLFFLLCFCGTFLIWSLATAPVASAASYIVNSTDDPGDGVCTSEHCTLHEAITSANANPGKDQISFDFPGAAPHSIQLTELLPEIIDPVVIDGSTQLGFVDAPIIELDGSQLSGGNGLEITGGDSLVRSLVINGFRGPFVEFNNAIHIQGEGGNVVQGCYLGTDVTGTVAVTNSEVFKNEDNNFPGFGVYIWDSSNNLIGGDQPGEGNLISGNNRGILIILSNGNSIQGNYIGTDSTGNNVIGNGLWFIFKETPIYEPDTGIQILGNKNTLIGGSQSGAGNIISGNSDGVKITDSEDFQIMGNYIGTNLDGSIKLGNKRDGISIRGFEGIHGENIIGGVEAGAGNLISGNGSGIYFLKEPQAALSGLKIMGNKIGTDHTGSYSIPNIKGIVIPSSSNPLDIVIGGDQPGKGNLISGNQEIGVHIGRASGIVIQGNYIGTDVTGSFAIPNSSGIVMSSAGTGNLVGGVTPDAGNLISGNDDHGILIQGDENRVYGNMIGTNSLGTSGIGNGLYGVTILDAEGNQIGGTFPGEGNLISGNLLSGVLISGSASQLNSVQGNLIGTDLEGGGDLGNNHGVAIDGGLFNLIGGHEDGAANRIAFSDQLGVWIKSGYSNSILSNIIYGSGGLGIELGEDGVTPNDSGDIDTGANELQNYPLLTSVESRVIGTTIVGELNSEAYRLYVLQFFTNENCNPSGHGEGESFLISSSVLTDEVGYASFTINLPEVVSIGGFLTATATSPTFDTSEFSACVPVVWANSPPFADPNGPYTSEEGSPISFNGTGSSDPDGDPLSFDWEFNDGNTGSGSTPNYTYTDNGLYDVCLTVTDTDGLADTQCTTAEISNVAPDVSINNPTEGSLFQVNTPVNLSASFSDPGVDDTHTCTINWGAGPDEPGTATVDTCTGRHTYTETGVNTISVIVTDNDGDFDTGIVMIVVYNPEGGFVTGGGWIDSPAGAYKPDPSLTGKATFGFVSKYKKGTSIPTGNTEFQFKTGDLNFQSSSYYWLIVNQGGTNAQYKGSGTINGEGEYRFMLWAGDDNLDTFRIKIWWEDGDSEHVVYDNGFGQPIGGGSIVIHTKKK